MNVGYHYPTLDTIYAQRTIHNGFKRAFEDLGHSFYTFSPPVRLAEFLERAQPDLFITASHFFYRKQLDYQLLKRHRDRGMVMITKVDFWNSPLVGRVNEAPSMKDDRQALQLMRDGLLGDHFFHVVEQDDSRMEGFETATGYPCATVPLAADKTMLPVVPADEFRSDVAYVGTWLPGKQRFFEENLFPLRADLDLRIYGQDWTRRERALGLAQKVGQYFNVPVLRSLQRPKLSFAQELSIYCSAAVSVNIHESYQRELGGDCNERTFKIPLAGGFEITDDVACIRKYFAPGVEIIIADSPADWREKVAHYVCHPNEREAVVEAGRARVLRDHTYHNRVAQVLELGGFTGPSRIAAV
jgi:spore maturation protein CgeB